MSTIQMNDGSFAGRLRRLAEYPFALAREGSKTYLIRLLDKLGRFCFWNGDYSYAEMAYDAILRLRPREANATAIWVELLDLLENDDKLSIAIIEDFLAEFPDNISAHLELSQHLLKIGDLERAKKELEVASNLSPGAYDILLNYAWFHRDNGDLDGSISILKSLATGDACEAALYWLALNKIDVGDRREAIELLEQVVERAPYMASAYVALAGCRYYNSESHSHIVYMEKTVQERKLPAIVLSQFHFALGEAYDSMDLTDKAFTHFRTGNELAPRLRKPTVKHISNFVSLQIQTFDQHLLNASQISLSRDMVGKSLIFVVGMPRSGTTLVEQILSSHPDVFGGGEREDINMIIQELCLLSGRWPLSLADLDSKTVTDVVGKYASRLARESQGRTYFVDKSLANTFQVGFLLSLFPWAKIIYCRRNPFDSCLSCYFKNLIYLFYSRDMRSIGLIYSEHERMMNHWHALFATRIFDVDYEDLVQQPEVHIPRLLNYCDLSWNENCSVPERTKRVVHTASASQVKFPIYTRSVGRWKKYVRYLGPLIEGLASSPNKATSHWWREYELYRRTMEAAS